jgi:hypothetical protein
MATTTKSATKTTTKSATKLPRVKLPASIKAFCQDWNLNPDKLLSTNPKTEKSAVQTYILHLAPADTAGFNVCPGAGNCKKVCLHFAGNPVYMRGKGAARIRRTRAYGASRQWFMESLVLSILLKRFKLDAAEPMAVRLNGTSDIDFENIDFNVSLAFARYCRLKFGIDLHIGFQNIFELFNSLSLGITFYDYTKVKHNWAECKRLGYHLTFSFDGYDNRSNVKIASDAVKNGVNIAAAFNIKKGKALPPVAYLCNRGFKVVDGDLTDYRPGDPKGFTIIGLRFKLPHGIAYTPVERDAFCLSADRMGTASRPA